jgi:serine/threonine protein kinase
LERIHLEINVLSIIKHKNIVQLIDSKQTSRNLYLVFEHCKNTDLESHIHKYYNGMLPEEQVKKVMIQIKNAFIALR